jgi:hypothetical protein
MDIFRRLFCAGLISTLLGCGDSGKKAARDLVDISRYQGLPGLSNTHHEGLQAELGRLVSERATPELLVISSRVGSVGVTALPKRRFNGTLALANLLPEPLLAQLQKAVDRAYPTGRFEFTARQLERAQKVSQEYREQRLAFREFLDDPDFVFQLDHSRGLGADTTFVDAMRAASRLESFELAMTIEHGQLQAAVDSVETLFSGAQALAAVRQLVPRGAAVHMRHELLEVIRAICHHPSVDSQIYKRLLRLIDDQLANLPPDADAWTGERAAGLHTYELIRDGYLLSVISYEELQEYRDEIGIQRFGKLVMKNLDEDEFFYLEAMRTTIQQCQRPFYQRQAHFQKLESDLESRREQADYPIIADHLLLSDSRAGSTTPGSRSCAPRSLAIGPRRVCRPQAHPNHQPAQRASLCRRGPA